NRSPAQATAGADVDPRGDVYSLGCVLYEMLAGEPPFTGPTAESIVRQHVSAEPPAVTAIRGGVPEAVATTIARALAKAPADRFTTAAHFGEALKVPRGPMVTTRAASRRPGRRKVVTAAGVTVVVIAVYLALTRGRSPAGIPPEPSRRMLAVLPFANLGPPEDAYFADGVTEEITARLATLPGLGVISRTSAIQYKNSPKPLKQIGQELGVGYVVEGTIRWERVGGSSRVRVTPQLIRVADDTHL